ncbi:MAG: thermonuclease family protein [Eubacteriales bacterium]|nr:thermonuclease family protein [Eubacteriales bacterium]
MQKGKSLDLFVYNKKYLMLLFALMLSIYLCVATAAEAPKLNLYSDLTPAVCTRFVDGDTAWFSAFGSEKEIKVRFIGIDSPEMGDENHQKGAYSDEASKYTKDALDKKIVFLEYDKEKFDQYGRHLCYIWFMDGTQLNYNIILNGLARVELYKPNTKYKKNFYEAQDYARENALGIWSEKASNYKGF